MSVQQIPFLGHNGDQGTVEPRVLRPAEDNPRRQLGDLTGLRSSIEAQGIIEPLVVTPDGLIIAGHRRHAVAVELDLDEVPIVVRDLDDAGRVEAMLAENLHREGLTPLEEAAGYRQLTELGRTQRALAGQFDVSQGHVSKRLALLKLPDIAQAAVDSGGISLEQAQALGKLPETRVSQLFAAGRPAGWKIDQAIEDQRVVERRAKETAKLEAAGVTVLPHTPRPMAWAPPPGSPRYGEPVFLHALPWVDEKAHASEPCRAGYVDHIGSGSRSSLVCTDISRHPKPEPTVEPQPADDGEPETEQPGYAQAAADHAQARSALLERLEERHSFVCGLVHEMDVPLSSIVELAVNVLPASSDYGEGRAARFAGLDDRLCYPDSFDSWSRYTQAGERNQARALLAMAAACAEDYMPTINYGGQPDDPEILVCRAWLTFLAVNGWEVDDKEQALLERLTGSEEEQAEAVHAELAPVCEVTIERPPRTKTWRVTCTIHGEVAARQTTEAFAGERRAAHLAEHGIPDDRQTALQGGGSE